MHRRSGGLYEDAASPVSGADPPPLWRSYGMEDFWADSIDFPTKGAGGFLGQTPPPAVGEGGEKDTLDNLTKI